MIYPKNDKLKTVTYELNITWKLINGIYTRVGGR
jgi:hypothetical protein